MRKVTPWFPISLLLALFVLQAIGGMWNNAATYDEVAHLPAGYGYITKGDLRFNPEHPPLIKMLAALPLLFMDLPPAESNPYWNSINEWQFGRSFLYQSGIDADRVLFLGRLPMVLLGALLGLLVFVWSRELYGVKAALFSLFLYCLEPNVIAHSQVVHTDLGFSLFFALSLYLFWKAMREPSRKKFMLAGIAFGLALATKYTAILLIPLFLVLILLHLLEEHGAIAWHRLLFRKEDRLTLRLRLYFTFFSFSLLLLAAIVVLAAFYGFSGISRYFDGLMFVLEHNRTGNPAFLFGMYSDTGWWYYFPLAFLIKTPLPVILFLGVSLILFVKKAIKNELKKSASHSLKKRNALGQNASEPDPSNLISPSMDSTSRLSSIKRSINFSFSLYDELYLLIPASLFLLFTAAGHINIGLRHILPLYPLIFSFCGRLFADRQISEKKFSLCETSEELKKEKKMMVKAKWKISLAALAIALMIWLMGSAIFIFPYHLSYFNELPGGPSNGYRFLADSNLDWGQDLIRLKEFLDREGEEAVILSYLGSADPNYYGIRYQYLPGYGLDHPQDYGISFRQKEFLAVSATNLQSVFFNIHDTYDWLKRKEPYARVGYSLFVWEISGDSDAHRNLARLYQEFGWNDLAQKHLSRLSPDSSR